MSIVNSIRAQLAPIHPEGYPFIGAFALASLILFWIWTPLGWLGTLLTLWCAYFFRDPVRVTPVAEGPIGVVQIAGLIARRIVCWSKEGQPVAAGERIGMIRFGSRVDVYLPAGTTPLVSEGQTSLAGETIIADLRNTASSPTFRVS